MIKVVLDYFAYLIFRFVMALFYVLPRNLVLKFLSSYARMFLKYNALYRKVTLVNLGFAYPQKSVEERLDFIDKIADELARTFYDVIRIPHLTKEWIESHISFDTKEEINKKYLNKVPVIFVTGHLGSFELLIYSCSFLKGSPINIVVRSFKNKFLNKYWNNIREKLGSKMIDKEGAYKSSIRAIRRREDIGFPFDQNMKIKDAVFVDFFGKKAATSKTLALLALRYHLPIVFAYMKNLGDDKYSIITKECFYDDIYNDTVMNHEEKIEALTSRGMKIFEEHVREFPAGWFWMHRRWKTRPEGEERFY